MIDPNRIQQWVDACQALVDDIAVVMDDDSSINGLAKALTDPTIGLEGIADQARQHQPINLAIDAIKGAGIYLEAAIHRTPSPGRS